MDDRAKTMIAAGRKTLAALHAHAARADACADKIREAAHQHEPIVSGRLPELRRGDVDQFEAALVERQRLQRIAL